MLKLIALAFRVSIVCQPPSGGCVLKPFRIAATGFPSHQPPSGGCVLKQDVAANVALRHRPAAFRRLCVETVMYSSGSPLLLPAAFRRLCVETRSKSRSAPASSPAAFRRLCVETAYKIRSIGFSRPAAFRRLCVETDMVAIYTHRQTTSRLQAAVC